MSCGRRGGVAEWLGCLTQNPDIVGLNPTMGHNPQGGRLYGFFMNEIPPQKNREKKKKKALACCRPTHVNSPTAEEKDCHDMFL